MGLPLQVQALDFASRVAGEGDHRAYVNMVRSQIESVEIRGFRVLEQILTIEPATPDSGAPHQNVFRRCGVGCNAGTASLPEALIIWVKGFHDNEYTPQLAIVHHRLPKAVPCLCFRAGVSPEETLQISHGIHGCCG